MQTLRQILKSHNNDYAELENNYYQVTGAQLVKDPLNSFSKGPEKITRSACILIGTFNSKNSLENKF